MSDDYYGFCERLWRDWLRGSLDVSAFVRRTFDLDAAPEPYISFDAGPQPLVALTTNPGTTMPHQRRGAVQAAGGPLRPDMTYATAAQELGAFYERELDGPANRRTIALKRLSSMVGLDGVLQVEVCPFHSPSLPNKNALLKAAGTDELIRSYVTHVRSVVRAQPVVVVSAVATRASLAHDTSLSPWVTWIAGLAGLDPSGASFVPLVVKGAKTTCGAFVGLSGGAPKALVLMMGSNQLPGKDGLETLAGALRKP
ncbi:MAG: hypothetical protein O3A25_09940 [Acidobacteria bacterium]|nr:hypothetical protein [Acidobacteriota bacterium]